MTGKEIIERLKELNIEVDQFAYDELPYFITNYPSAQEAIEIRNKFAKEHYKDYKWDSEENRVLYQQLPNPHSIAKELYHKEIGLIWKEVDQYGGEGKGDTWYSIKYFKDHDVYLRVDGWYSSYYGTDFADWDDAVKEVRPQEKTIIVYE